MYFPSNPLVDNFPDFKENHPSGTMRRHAQPFEGRFLPSMLADGSKGLGREVAEKLIRKRVWQRSSEPQAYRKKSGVSLKSQKE